MQTGNDPFVQFKAVQREGWALFAPLEAITTIPAGKLVDFAKLSPGSRVLDVACGTGVVAVTAARAGARVKGLDLSPVLLERARENARLAGVEIDFVEGDAEALPYKDGEFDVVMSQFGHMFAPRPAVVVSEMLRVLKPGGRIVFATWPPEHFVGMMFSLVGRYLPPPAGVAPAPQWGDVNVVRERLGEAVSELAFSRDEMHVPTLSPQHSRHTFEQTAAPVIKLVATLKDDPAKLARFRGELEALVAAFTQGNTLRQHYLLTRATKL